MPVKKINTYTHSDVSSVNGTPSDIIVEYIGDNVNVSDLLPDVYNAKIESYTNNVNQAIGLENDLILTIKKSPTEFQCYINDNGDLIISTNTNDIHNYTINSNGDLLYIFNSNN